MKKQVVSILLSLIMLLSIIPISSVFAAGTTSLVVTADKTTAYSDDTVNFTISIGTVEHLMGAEFKLVIPAGMTYIAGSASVADGLKATLGCASADWTEKSMKFTMYGDGDYSSNSNTKILTFSCKINSGAVGSIIPQINEIVLSNTKFEEITTQVDTTAGIVTVAQRPVAVTGVSLNKKVLSLNGGESETLIAIVSPENSTNKAVTWKSSDITVATVDNNGKVTAITRGTATVTVTTEDGKFTDTCEVSVACSHTNTTVHPAKASTCQIQGHNEYTVCDDCGALISGSDAKLPLAPHNYIEKVEPQYLKSDATCVSRAVYYKSCSVCGEKSKETFAYGEVNPENHTGGTYVKNQKEATCYEEGYTGDICCSDCKAVITAGTVIEINAHNPASVWSTDENYHWKECQTVGCGNIIDKAEHTGGEATCTKRAICEVCGVEYGTINADNHKNTEIRNAIDATCMVDGYTGDVYCKDCGAKITDGTVIPAVGHKLNKVEAKDATHEADGNIEYYVCSVCGKLFRDAEAAEEIALEDTVIAKGEHDYGDSYKSDAENHWKECACGNIIDKDVHTFGEWTVIKSATETEKGIKERACSICGYKETEDVPVIFVEDNTDNNVIDNPTDEPTLPENSSESATSKGQENTTIPNTGNAGGVVLWRCLMLITAASVTSYEILKKKKRIK